MKDTVSRYHTGRYGAKMLLIATMPIVGLSCKVFTTLTTPVESCVYRGSLISVDIPPITLTPSRTAAERQLVGDDRELEKDGWLIASMQSGQKKEGDESQAANLNEARSYYRDLSIVEFYNDLVTDYRRGGLLGESSDGHLRLVPSSLSPRTGHFANPAEVENAQTIAREVNQARDRIYEYMKQRNGKEDEKATEKDQTSDGGDSETEQRVIHRRYYYEHAHSGEWIFNEKQEWIRVP